jgi:hypothetical protein
VDGRRIAETALVLGERHRIEEAQALGGLGEFLLDEIVGVGAHQPLGKVVGLDHEEPMPGKRAPLARDVVEQVVLRDDVEDGGAGHLGRVVEAHAMEHARAAVMAGSVEALEAQRRHHLDLILRHGAEGVGAVVLSAGRLLRIPVAAQIRGDHGELAGQSRRHLMPGDVRERIAVHEQQRRSLAAMHRHDARAAGLDLGASEAFEHHLDALLRSLPENDQARDGAACPTRDAAIISAKCRRPWRGSRRWAPPGRCARQNPPAS